MSDFGQRGRLKRGGVYAITPTELCGAELIGAAETALVAGAALLQYRAKPANADDAKQLAKICAQHRVPLIINDDIELAAELQCGVHLGEHDTDVASARQRLGGRAIIGASCYNDISRAQAAVAAGASYIAFGAIYASQTKPHARVATLDLFTQAKTFNVPMVAIGGIDASNAADVIAAGANYVAAVNGVFEGDIAANVRALRACLGVARPIRSFVLRQGRLTGGQGRAMDDLLPQFGVAQGVFNARQSFGDSRDVVLEIGFGNGDALVECAAAAPELGFIGAEVHAPGVGRALLGIEREQLSNVRIVHGDVVPFLRQQVADASLTRIHIWFPDPWHKTRHHKRRLIQPDFVALLASKLKPGGILHLATDWENYAQHMHDVLIVQTALQNMSANGAWCAKPDWRPSTHFERRGQRLGHGVWDLLWCRKV
jgi:tRNA (guanine-N7-)-methyltransferase